jgi:hypothetical protein
VITFLTWSSSPLIGEVTHRVSAPPMTSPGNQAVPKRSHYRWWWEELGRQGWTQNKEIFIILLGGRCYPERQLNLREVKCLDQGHTEKIKNQTSRTRIPILYLFLHISKLRDFPTSQGVCSTSSKVLFWTLVLFSLPVSWGPTACSLPPSDRERVPQ